MIKALQLQADAKGISFNTLANQIFTEYIQWYANAPKAGYATVRRSLIKALFDRLAGEETIALANTTVKDSREISLQITGEYDLSSILQIIDHKSYLSGYKVRKEARDDYYYYVIQHDLGKKWSLYLGELFKLEFEEVGYQAEFEMLENTIAFKVKI